MRKARLQAEYMNMLLVFKKEKIRIYFPIALFAERNIESHVRTDCLHGERRVKGAELRTRPLSMRLITLS